MVDSEDKRPPPTRPLRYSVKRRDEELVLHLDGSMDENADLFDLIPMISGVVRIDLGGVRRINSAGVRDWVNFIRQVQDRADEVTLSRCSPAIVMQMNMISNFRGEAQVQSIFAPLVCPECDREDDVLVSLTPEQLEVLPDGVPERPCPDCGAVMELDDIPERYFAFLNLPSSS